MRSGFFCTRMGTYGDGWMQEHIADIEEWRAGAQKQGTHWNAATRRCGGAWDNISNNQGPSACNLHVRQGEEAVAQETPHAPTAC